MDKRIKVLRGWNAVNRIDIEKNFNATYMLINKDLRSLKVAIYTNTMDIFYKNELIHKIDIIKHKDIDFRGVWSFEEVINHIEGCLSCNYDSMKKDKKIQFNNYINFVKNQSGINFKINYTAIRVFFKYFYNQITVYDTDNTIYSFENNALISRILNESDFLKNNKITIGAKVLINGKNKGSIDTFLCDNATKYLLGGVR